MDRLDSFPPSDIDALLITNPTNIRYLTGFVGAAPEEREAYCLLIQNKLFLFTNALYIEQVKNLRTQNPMTNTNNIEIIEISRENPISQELAKKAKGLNIKKIGFEDTNLTVAELTKLKQVLGTIELVPTRDTVENLRMIKRPDEIAHIRLAAEITDQCFKFITRRLRPGITEYRVALEIEGYIRAHGAELAFSPIVAFNEHSAQPHYLKRSYDPLRPHSLVLLDFGAKINGYCADMTRVVFIGKPKNEWIKSYNIVLAAQQAAIDILYKHFDLSINRSGSIEISGAAMDQAARDVIINAGLPVYPHSLGHAVGLDIHEPPRLSVTNSEVLKPGMVFSVEPGVYIEGQYGIRIEDLVLLKENGIEILSKSKKDILIL